MNLHQPFSAQTKFINPWLNWAPVPQNVLDGIGKTDCGLPPGLPSPSAPNARNALSNKRRHGMDEESYVGSELGVGGEMDEHVEEKLDDDDGQSARVTSEMGTQLSTMRITVLHGKRTFEDKRNTGLDSHNATESHFSNMGALKAANRIKTNCLLSRMESNATKKKIKRKLRAKICKICMVRGCGCCHLDHTRTMQHKKNKRLNKYCHCCKITFSARNELTFHRKSQEHNAKMKHFSQLELDERVPAFNRYKRRRQIRLNSEPLPLF